MMSGPDLAWTEAARRAGISLALMCSMVMVTLFFCPHSAALASKYLSPSGTKCDHCSMLSVVPLSTAGAPGVVATLGAGAGAAGEAGAQAARTAPAAAVAAMAINSRRVRLPRRVGSAAGGIVSGVRCVSSDGLFMVLLHV